jgi:hypothetical protein
MVADTGTVAAVGEATTIAQDRGTTVAGGKTAVGMAGAAAAGTVAAGMVDDAAAGTAAGGTPGTAAAAGVGDVPS